MKKNCSCLVFLPFLVFLLLNSHHGLFASYTLVLTLFYILISTGLAISPTTKQLIISSKTKGVFIYDSYGVEVEVTKNAQSTDNFLSR
jgi:hypothetical protein